MSSSGFSGSRMTTTGSQATPKPMLVRKEPLEIVEHLNMDELTRHLETTVPVDEPLFEPNVRKIEFRDFEPFETYSVTVSLRNKDFVARRVKILQPNHECFELSVPLFAKHSNTGKIAPGMQMAYTLSFKPAQKIDISCDLVVVTEREKFLLPIRAYGQKAKIQFPGEIIFESSPVKYTSTRAILMRNTGNKDTSFRFIADEPFAVDPQQGSICVGENLQITVKFCPQEEGDYEGDIIFVDEDGERLYCNAYGISTTVDVHLEFSELTLPSACIDLESQMCVTLFNRSRIPIHFEWKTLATISEEQQLRSLETQRLKIEHTDDMASIDDLIETLSDDSAFGEEDSESEMEQYKQLKALQVVQRKFKKLNLANDHNRFLFENEHFRIEPRVGDVWPNGFVEFTVFFMPGASISYLCTAFCDVTGRSLRLPLHLRAQGIGPKALFSYDSLEVGEVFINSIYKYEVKLQNVGEIPCTYSLHKAAASLWSFKPDHATLAPDESHVIEASFSCNTLGPFLEVTRWNLKGRIEPLYLTFRGTVCKPKFHLECPDDELEYNIVSLGFLATRSFTIVNDSNIPMKFFCRIPDDGRFMQKEFDICPSSGVLLPLSSVQVNVDFISQCVRKYHYTLVIDVDGVGLELASLGIHAECHCPQISIINDLLDFGECFLQYEYTKDVEFNNEYNLPAMFEHVAQDETSKQIATILANTPKGSIAPHAITVSSITIKTHKLGPFRIPIYFSVVGSEQPPLAISCTGTSIGPRIVPETSVMNWGRVLLLNPSPLSLNIHNQSPIPAQVQAFLHRRNSVFNVDQTTLMFEPNQKKVLNVSAYLDDPVKARDRIHLLDEDSGVDMQVEVRAEGIGSPIYCSDCLDVISLGDVFTTKECSVTFRLENKGRRQQIIQWYPVFEEVLETKKSRRGSVKEESITERTSVFTLTPDRIIMHPQTAAVFTIEGSSNKAGLITETWYCKATGGAAAKEGDVIFQSAIKANFFCPLLEFSQPSFVFTYTYDPAVSIGPQSQTLHVTNISPLPLVFLFKCPSPFSVDKMDLDLGPGESNSIQIQFDPALPGGRLSTEIKSLLEIHYRDHPQRDKIPLVGHIHFPNLAFDTNKADFGCVLNDTSAKQTVQMRNPSECEVVYYWEFVEYVDEIESKDNQSYAINEVFDISPIRGSLKPGENQEIVFSFYGHPECRLATTAVCVVDGGPEYDIVLNGEASSIHYRLDRDEVDFHELDYARIGEGELTLTNTCRATIPFSIDIPDGIGNLQANPLSGIINAMSKQPISIKFCPGAPELISRRLDIQVAFFDPQPVVVTCQGVYPQICLTLPRAEHPTWEERIDNAKRTLQWQDTEDNSIAQALPNRFPIPLELEADRLLLMHRLSLGPLKSPCVIASFVCDFGNLIRGVNSKTSFAIQSFSNRPITIQVNSNQLRRYPFSIDERTIRIQDDQPVQVAVSYNSRGPNKDPLGNIRLDIPLEVKEGPVYNIVLLANMTEPELEISQRNLDFGLVYVGHRKEITIRLTNNKQVPCTWNIGRPVSRNSSAPGKEKKERDIGLVPKPDSGTILPGDYTDVVFIYTPTEKREFALKFPVFISKSPKNTAITCTGSSQRVLLKFEPSSLKLGPILPGKKSVPQPVVLHNESNMAIDVYSVDHDKQYLFEESILKEIPQLQQNPVACVPRDAGKPLPDEILKLYAKIRETKLNEKKMSEDSTQDTEVGEQKSEVVDEEHENQIQQLLSSLQSESDCTQTLAVPGIKAYFLVVGAPSIGKSTLSKAVATSSDMLYASLDSMIQHHLSNADESGVNIASLKGKLSGNEAAEALGEIVFDFFSSSSNSNANGVVIDGLDSMLIGSLPYTAVAAGIRYALSKMGVELHIADLKASVESIKERIDARKEECEAVLRQKPEKVTKQIKEFVLLSQPELQSMSSKEVKAYEDTMLKWQKVQSRKDAQDFMDRVGRLDSLIKEYLEQEQDILQLLTVSSAEDAQIESKIGDIDSPVNNWKCTKWELNAELSAATVANRLVESVHSFYRDKLENEWLSQGFKSNLVQLQGGVSIRAAKSCITHFAFVEAPSKEEISRLQYLAVDPEAEAIALEEKKESKVTKSAPKKAVESKVKSGKDVKEEAEEQLLPLISTCPVRWIIPACSSITVFVQHAATEVGKLTQDLRFEIAGQSRGFVLPCEGTCAYPEIATDCRSVFMKRIRKARPNIVVKKQFIQDQKLFDFGPLLINKNPEKRREACQLRTNSDVFRITNSGLLPGRVRLCLQGPTGLDGGPIANYAANVFSIDPQVLDLAVDEVKNVTVFCYPTSVGVFQDTLVCKVDYNTNATLFPMRCEGVKPMLESDADLVDVDKLLVGHKAEKTFVISNPTNVPVQWRLVANGKAMCNKVEVLEVKEESKTAPRKPPPKKNKPAVNADRKQNKEQKGASKPETKESTPRGEEKDSKKAASEKKETKSDKNKALDSKKQAVEQNDSSSYELPDEFKIEPLNGLLRPRSSSVVHTAFSALKPKTYTINSAIEFRDNEDVGLVSSRPLTIQAEAYIIDYLLQLPEEGLQFLMRAGDQNPVERTFAIKNNGDYELKFNFSANPKRRKLFASIFTLDPAEAIVPPKQQTVVKIAFRSEQPLSITNASDLKLHIYDCRTNERTASVSIKINSARALGTEEVDPELEKELEKEKERLVALEKKKGKGKPAPKGKK